VCNIEETETGDGKQEMDETMLRGGVIRFGLECM
jgi:hypothetical protein